MRLVSSGALFLVAAACLTGSGGALAQGVPSSGSEIAQRWCAQCHVVRPEQVTANADVPTFESIARKSGDDFEWLKAFLADPHPPMPNLSLSRQEIADLAAYIGTLR